MNRKLIWTIALSLLVGALAGCAEETGPEEVGEAPEEPIGAEDDFEADPTVGLEDDIGAEPGVDETFDAEPVADEGLETEPAEDGALDTDPGAGDELGAEPVVDEPVDEPMATEPAAGEEMPMDDANATEDDIVLVEAEPGPGTDEVPSPGENPETVV